MISSNQIAALAFCAIVAVGTIAVDRSLWQLGTTYWLLLSLLALLQLVATGLVFVAKRGGAFIRLGAVALLLVGQWWAVQLLVMQIMWRIGGFAP